MRHLPGELPSHIVPVSFTPLFDIESFDIFHSKKRVVDFRLHNHRCFYRDTISRRVATQEPLPPMRQTSPRSTPTRYFMVSYYTLLKGDLEVIVAKGNLILPRRNSTTGCSLWSYPGQIIIIIYYYYCYYYYYSSKESFKEFCLSLRPKLIFGNGLS